MQTNCPSCGVVVEASPGQRTTCVECGQQWVPEAPVVAPQGGSPAAVPVEFELQFADGDRWQGPFNRFHLREMLYTERLTGQEYIREPGAAGTEVLSERPEFAEVLALLGKQEETTGRRSSIVGWKKGGSVAEAAEAERVRKEEALQREREARIAEKEGPSRTFVVVGLVTISVLLVALVATLVLT